MKRYRSLGELPDYVQNVVRSGRTRQTGLLCPECHGGQHHEHSLGVYRIGNELVLKCYRIKCQHLGKLWLSDAEMPTGLADGFEPRPFLGDLVRMPAGARRYLLQKYRIKGETIDTFGVKAVYGLHALYLPVRGPYGSDRGGVVRRFDDWGQKADSFKTVDEPWQAWYTQTGSVEATVLVEDQLSAMRLWQLGYNAVALLGASVSDERAVEIERNQVVPVWLALDADAFAAGCMAAKRRHWIDRVVLLERDIKDITDEEIEARLNG